MSSKIKISNEGKAVRVVAGIEIQPGESCDFPASKVHSNATRSLRNSGELVLVLRDLPECPPACEPECPPECAPEEAKAPEPAPAPVPEPVAEPENKPQEQQRGRRKGRPSKNK